MRLQVADELTWADPSATAKTGREPRRVRSQKESKTVAHRVNGQGSNVSPFLNLVPLSSEP